MKHIMTAAALIAAAGAAHAGEFRGSAAYGIGGSTYEEGSGDELTADVSQLALSATYFLDEAGAFFGMGYLVGELGDFEFNGRPVGLEDQDVNVTSFRLGYRAGRYGAAQLVIAANYARSDSDDGDDSDSTGLAVGVERTSESGRLALTADYSNGDSTDSYGIEATGVLAVAENIGIGISALYSLGDGESGGMDTDVSSWIVGVGVELRFVN
ncbi:hypothetical protein [Algiphilus sp.]|uniref:hypothetical protein n=1 Tax=Algiphilus sp. TaxID=1872431 RepID=UPI0025C70DB6|nr:hypothetical protein [Algiphilus sp.]MCK5771260.1 hypothetical protein [Algiphilus sp.]